MVQKWGWSRFSHSYILPLNALRGEEIAALRPNIASTCGGRLPITWPVGMVPSLDAAYPAAGHVSRRMIEHYSHIRMEAKWKAVDAIAAPPVQPPVEEGVNQNVNQLGRADARSARKSLN